MAIDFTVIARCSRTNARLGRVTTPHGSFDTPAFMPVGTRATVKGLTPDQVLATGSQIILNNAYHLMLRPGDERIARIGGVHAFMRWPGPILTDSGGFQAFSMSDIAKIDDNGVTFRSIIDGARISLTPERSIEVQNNLGADIIMAFDDCPPAAGPDGAIDRPRLVAAHDRTVRWLHRCVASHRRDDQALFGIVQGGTDLALRDASVDAICALDLPGYAIGGVAVGERPDEIRHVVAHTAPRLPADRPRYLMGVGYEDDILAAVAAGVDMFDCVLPTRNGRNGHAFTREGRLHLRNAVHTEDDDVIDATCDCLACGGGYSRAYLRHLFMAREMLGPVLVSLHNIRHFQRVMLDIRRGIRENDASFLLGSWPGGTRPQDAGSERARRVHPRNIPPRERGAFYDMFEFSSYGLTLAQDGTAGLPGEATPTTTGTTDGGAAAAARPASSGPFSTEFLFIMLGLLVLMVVMSSMGPRRERKRREAMIKAIKKHDRVQTVGGVIGAIVELKPDTVVLKVDESANTRITFARSAIQEVLTASGGEKDAGVSDNG